MATYYLIGCGGIGGWIASSLTKTLTENDTLVLVDGDKLEEKNIDRQLFDPKWVGEYKSEAMWQTLQDGARCAIRSEPEYLGESQFSFQPNPSNWVIVGADNHPARRLALRMAEEEGLRFISAANGYEEAEAFFYMPQWEATPMDPRVYYPEILTGTEGDPLAPPCTGEVLESAPQLAIANQLAASYAMWLLWFWREKFGELPEEENVMNTVPFHVTSTAGRMRVITLGDVKEVANDDRAVS